MTYSALAKLSFFISPGSHCCKCPKRSKNFFNKEKIDALTAKCLIARDLIFNKHMKNMEEPTISKWRRRGPIDHFLIMLPKKIIKNGRLVACKDPYQRQTCGVCRTKRCRSYCSCTPGLILCTDCYANHRAEIAMVNS